jgi:hypothetical protein
VKGKEAESTAVNIKRKRNWLYMDYGTTNSNFLQMDKCRVPYLLVQPHEVPGLSTQRQQNSDGGGPVGQLVQILKPTNFVHLTIKHRKDQNHYAVGSVADPGCLSRISDLGYKNTKKEKGKNYLFYQFFKP